MFSCLQNLTKDENILSELMNEVLQVYVSLQGVHPVKAEIQYMKEIQMMDGYGMEYYVAKVNMIVAKVNESHHEKTCFLHMQKQMDRSAAW